MRNSSLAVGIPERQIAAIVVVVKINNIIQGDRKQEAAPILKDESTRHEDVEQDLTKLAVVVVVKVVAASRQEEKCGVVLHSIVQTISTLTRNRKGRRLIM